MGNPIDRILRSLSRGWRVQDSAPVNKDLREFLVGQQIKDVESGAQTQEGYGVTRMRFASGDSILIVPVPVDPAVTQETGVTMATMFVFQPRQGGRVWLPAHDGWWN
jgi:hypothetical protein